MVMLGCDPEFTIFDADNNPVPAHVAGFNTSKDPHTSTHSTPWGSEDNVVRVFRDGFNVEVNTPARTCRGLELDLVAVALNKARSLLPDGYALSAKSAFKVDLKFMDDAPEDLQQFGCSPSMDAYSGMQKTVDLDARTHPWRYAGGHLHFGEWHASNWSAISNRARNNRLVQLFDLFIGVPLAYIFHDDGQWQRRKYYGQAGEYRQQTYGDSGYVGVEYRTPGAELFNNCIIASLFMGVGRWTINNFETLDKKYPFTDTFASAVIKAINNGSGADQIIHELNLNVPNAYNPDILSKLRSDEKMHKFDFPGIPPLQAHRGAHYGWGDYAAERNWHKRSGDWNGIIVVN